MCDEDLLSENTTLCWRPLAGDGDALSLHVLGRSHCRYQRRLDPFVDAHAARRRVGGDGAMQIGLHAQKQLAGKRGLGLLPALRAEGQVLIDAGAELALDLVGALRLEGDNVADTDDTPMQDTRLA